MKEKISKIFLTSNSKEEIFDNFQLAIVNEIDDLEIYQTLLANPILSTDEIKLYCGKLCSQFPTLSYELQIWTAQIFENCNTECDCLDNAIDFYHQAFLTNPSNELSTNPKIIDIIEEGVKSTNKKSIVYEKLSKIYKQKGNVQRAERYAAKAAKYRIQNL